MDYRHAFYGDARPVPDPAPSGVVVAVAFFGGVVVLGVMGISGGIRHPGPALVALCVFAALVTWCAPARVGAAVGVAGVCWLLYNGFVIPEFGELGWDSTADSRRIGLLLGAALVGTVLNWLFSAWAAYGRIDPEIDPSDPRG